MATEQEILDMSADDVFENIDDSNVTQQQADDQGTGGDQTSDAGSQDGQAASGDEGSSSGAQADEGGGDDNSASAAAVGDDGDEGSSDADDGQQDDSGAGDDHQEVSIETLQSQLKDLNTQLERERKGLLRGIRDERAKRQQLEGRIAQVTDFISKRTTAGDDQQGQQDGFDGAGDDDQQGTITVGKNRIEIEYDDEGNPYVSPENIANLTKKQTRELQKEVNDLKSMIQQQATATAQQERQDAQLQAVLKQDQRFPKALELASAQIAHFDEVISQYVYDNELAPPKTIPEILDMVDAVPEISENFAKKYPGVDVITLVDGVYSPSKAKFVRMLKNVAKTVDQSPGDNPGNKGKGNGTAAADGKEKMKTLKTLAGKPGNLSNAQNQSAGANEMTLDSIAAMSQEQIDNMSDAEIEKLQQMLSG